MGDVSGEGVLPAQEPRESVIADVYRRHSRDVRDYIRAVFGMGPPEPDDVVQAAFTKFAALEDPSVVRNHKSFLITTARNIVLDHHKAAKTRSALLNQVAQDAKNLGAAFDDLSPERVFLAKEELGILKRALSAMPARRRQLLIMQRVHGMSYVVIAKKTGLSQTTVKYHVAMAFADCLAAIARAHAGKD